MFSIQKMNQLQLWGPLIQLNFRHFLDKLNRKFILKHCTSRSAGILLNHLIRIHKFFISDSESLLVIGFMQLKLAQIIRIMF